jgi:hypothetical protein
MVLPCVPDNSVARQILDSCAAVFAGNSDDCNKFLKAALLDFLAVGYLDGLDADGIVGKLQNPGQGWTRSRDIGTAIAQAKSGNLVVAGMTSASLGQHHGHVAVVVGCDGQVSGETIVPVGYAGALDNPTARLDGGRLSGTFAAALVRSEGLDYYFKAPDRTPDYTSGRKS